MVLRLAAHGRLALSARSRWWRWLRWLLLATVFSSVLHYADNLVYFDQYPEPPWINRLLIDAFWLLMTPLAWIGYRLLRRGSQHAGTAVLLAYCACNALTLGHYLYAPWHHIAARIHGFILLEALLAGALAVHLSIPDLKKTP